jgi:hypothetical protein
MLRRSPLSPARRAKHALVAEGAISDPIESDMARRFGGHPLSRGWPLLGDLTTDFAGGMGGGVDVAIIAPGEQICGVSITGQR